jgi:sigma-B regulation protein RsbU (phosphoserine phosphatase)
MRILLIDDSEDARDLTEAALLSAGFKDVMTADSAWAGFRLLDLGHTKSGPTSADIILLDIVMPEIDGIEACARIRNDPRYLDIPIIMITSLDDMDSLTSAFAAGANDYVSKPANRMELAARIQSALKLKAELERRQERERQLLTFLTNWGDRRANVWIDEVTGLFVGEVIEAYLTGVELDPMERDMSILALKIDRLDAIRAHQGEDVARSIQAQAARVVRGAGATVGVAAASYRDGLIVLVAPDMNSSAARQLGEHLCAAVARIRVFNGDAVAAVQVTASVSVVSGRSRGGVERVHLLTQAISAAQATASSGGNRVTAAAA